MKLPFISTNLMLCFLLKGGDAFSTPPAFSRSGNLVSQTALFMVKNRKARRTQDLQKQGKSRQQQFFDAIEKVSGDAPTKTSPGDDEAENDDGNNVSANPGREAQMNEAKEEKMESRPEVSTMIVDEETGIEVVAQGKAVMDVVTRKAVKLSDLGPEYRLAQMFPGAPPDIRASYRFDWSAADVPQMVMALREACSVQLEDGTVGIPRHPSVANKGIDFVLANRDYLSYRMKRTLGSLQMRSMWKGNVEEAREYKKLWRNFLTLENHISAPFRQIIMDGEGRVGPNFGNLDVVSFCGGELYERVANYIVLKGMVAHWEKKTKDAAYTESNPQTEKNAMTILSTGDPKRYLPDPPILFRFQECQRVVEMARQMCDAFVGAEELFSDFPPEIRFLEIALSIKGGTSLRKFMIEDFCPAEQITQEALREGMQRLYAQLDNMQTDPYGDLTNIVEKLVKAMSVGTIDERDPYTLYLANPDPDGPGYFQTYTFNHGKLSLVRFLDSQYNREGTAEVPSLEVPNLFDIAGQAMQKKGSEVYKVPETRAAGRPHELGWLDMLGEEDEKDMRFGKVPEGRIIPTS